jgi:hypothetical protein
MRPHDHYPATRTQTTKPRNHETNLAIPPKVFGLCLLKKDDLVVADRLFLSYPDLVAVTVFRNTRYSV